MDRSGGRERRRTKRVTSRLTESDDENHEETSSEPTPEDTNPTTTRRESLTFGINVLDNAQQLREWVNRNPEETWRTLIRWMDSLQTATSDVVRENLEAEKQELELQLEEALRLNETLKNDHDRMAIRLAQSIINRAEPADRIEPVHRLTTEPKKSYKLPDPPLLDDGKNPRFEDWQLQMQSRLRANADHFSTPDLRKAYVASRCTGRAAKHITPRMREESTTLYADSADMMKHLDEIFGDPNRLVNARRGYRELMMRRDTDFNTFLSDFLHLADEAGVPTDSRKEDFY